MPGLPRSRAGPPLQRDRPCVYADEPDNQAGLCTNTPTAKWRVSACFKIQNPASFALAGLLKSGKLPD